MPETTRQILEWLANYGVAMVVVALVLAGAVTYTLVNWIPRWRASSRIAIEDEEEETHHRARMRTLLEAEREAAMNLVRTTTHAVESFQLSHADLSNKLARLADRHDRWDANARYILNSLKRHGLVTESIYSDISQFLQSDCNEH